MALRLTVLLLVSSIFAVPRSVATPATPATPAALSCGEGALSPMEKAHPEALAPEPTQPVVECGFTRDLRCVPPSPTRAAWQMAPFSQCPRTIARWSRDLFHAAPQFSRKETRAHRLALAKKGCTATPPTGPCCYVQYSTQACD